jgi:argininosuccinate lyase
MKGIAFREAHSITARLVKYAIKKNKDFNELKLNEYKRISTYFEDDVYEINLRKSVGMRSNYGGTSPRQVKQSIKKAKQALS